MHQFRSDPKLRERERERDKNNYIFYKYSVFFFFASQVIHMNTMNSTQSRP